MDPDSELDPDVDAQVETFWREACRQTRLVTMPGYFGPSSGAAVRPPAWSFGASPEQADALLELVLSGVKTATASAAHDYAVTGRDAEDEPIPVVGALGIVLDGAGRPRALIETTAVTLTTLDEVGEEHAYLEGEGDRSLTSWRETHERFFATTGSGPVSGDLPVVLERFDVRYQD